MSTANALTVISGEIYKARESFQAVLVDQSINFEREAGFAIQVLAGNQYAMSTAMNNRQSVIDAVTNIAAIGISLNPAKKQAYLVPRDGRICLDISYMGLMDLAQASGSVKWAQAALVHENDGFTLTGIDKPPQHTFNPFGKERGPVVGVYVTIKTVHGEYLTHTMTLEEAHAIRDRSSAWKAYKSGKAKSPGPWGTDEGEMIKKTCVKQAYKYWPRSERMDTAIHHLNTDNGEGLAVIEEEKAQPRTGPVIPARPRTEDLNIAPDRLAIVKAVAESVIDHFNNDDLIGAYEENIGITDNEERIALSNELPANIRNALHKHHRELKEKEPA